MNNNLGLANENIAETSLKLNDKLSRIAIFSLLASLLILFIKVDSVVALVASTIILILSLVAYLKLLSERRWLRQIL